MIARLRGWPLLLLLVGMVGIGTALALALVGLLLWVLPDAPDAPGLSANATALLLGVLALPSLVIGFGCLAVGVLLGSRRAPG